MLEVEDHHGAYGFGVRKRKGERIYEFCRAMNMSVVMHGDILVRMSPCMSLVHLRQVDRVLN